LVVHPFFVYPYSLVLLARLGDWHRGGDQGLVQSAESPESPASSRWEPRVALVVSTHNEGKSMESKLRNSAELDYPNDRLHVYLLSDGCDDETMSIAARFSNTTVFHSEIRLGKSAVIEEFVPGIDTDILVFSDANSLYDSQAIRFLVEPLRTPSVGYVVGNQKYFEAKNFPAAEAENVYWNRESWIKSLESRLGSVVGGDGAIYAIRRSDYVSLQPNDESDFYLPLQLEIKGLEGFYEPRAICHENASERFTGQFFRKLRIANRGLHSTTRSLAALNPSQVGIFAYMLWSHKVLRWLMPLNSLAATTWLGCLVLQGKALYQWLAIPPTLILLAALMYFVPYLGRFRPFYLSFYLCAMNLAVLLGVISFALGYRVKTWQPDRS